MTAKFAMGCKISAYHYDLVCKLVLILECLACRVYAFVHRYFNRSKLLGVIRAGLIIVSLGFAWELLSRRYSSQIFPFAIPSGEVKNDNGLTNTGLVLPAFCFIDHPGVKAVTSYDDFTASPFWTSNMTSSVVTNSSSVFENTNSSASAVNGTMMTIFEPFRSSDVLHKADGMFAYGAVTIALVITLVASVLLATIPAPDEKPKSKSNIRIHWTAFVLRILSFIIVYVVLIYDAITFINLRTWMRESRWFADDDGEYTLNSFGQLMPLILLILPGPATLEERVGKSIPCLCVAHRKAELAVSAVSLCIHR
jgi:hypothetical protein